MLSLGRLGTRDLPRAKVFYDGVAEVLGARLEHEMPQAYGYRGSEGGLFVIGVPFEGEATAGNGTQMAFQVASRDVIDRLHAKALELGGTCAGAPGFRGPEENGFYACYFRDLDGNKLAAFHFGQS